MGTYTTNYNLFMPSVGESGWGDLVNGNFTTIDTMMKSLDNRIGILEPLSIIQVDSNMNVAFPANVIAPSFNGTTIKSGNITVTPTDTIKCTIPRHTGNYGAVLTILPLQPNTTYSGSIKVTTSYSYGTTVYFYNGTTDEAKSLFIKPTGLFTFSNISYLLIEETGSTAGDNAYIYDFTLS